MPSPGTPQPLSAAQARELEQAFGLLRVGAAGEALAIARHLAAEAPQAPDVHHVLALCHAGIGDVGAADDAFLRARELAPDHPLLLVNHATFLRSTGRMDAAEAAFRQVVTLAPGYRSASINLGSLLRLSGRSDEAVACLQGVGDGAGADPELADSLVGALLDAGRPDEALQLARQVASRHPEFVPGIVTLANLLWEYAPAQDAGEPFQLFRTALRQRPHDPALRRAYLDFLFSARSAEDALEQVRIARTLSDEPMLALMEANALEMLGLTGQSGALYAQLHRAWGNGVPALSNAHARHLLKAGQWDAATHRFEEATRVDPANQEAWAGMATAWRLLDDPREDWLCAYDRLIGVVDVETPPEFADRQDFLQALEATLEGLHQARREPVQQSLRGGTQTPGRLFGRRDPVIAAVQAALLRSARRWLDTLPTDERHPFLRQRTRDARPGGSWSVKLWSSGKHVNHIHPEGWMSSAFYVSLPPSVVAAADSASQAGHLQFGQPPLELGLALPPRRVIRPECGKLVLFPSYLWHGTVPFEDAQPRITIAFDLVPAGRFSERHR